MSQYNTTSHIGRKSTIRDIQSARIQCTAEETVYHARQLGQRDLGVIKRKLIRGHFHDGVDRGEHLRLQSFGPWENRLIVKFRR